MLASLQIAARLTIEDINVRLRGVARHLVRKIVEIVLSDLDLTAGLSGLGEAAAFERTHFLTVRYFKSRDQLYVYAISSLPTEDNGLLLEFGVYKGNSINRLARLTDERHWYGFDSFEGLPEIWTPGARKGAFDVDGRLPPVRTNVTLIKGFFEDTLSQFVTQHQNKKISFLHIDCDLYSATKLILTTLDQMLSSGCIIVFDEYFNYPDWKNGEHKAFMEFIAESGRTFEYIAYVRHGSQVAVRLF